jgi:hypothetical protein
LRCPTIPTGSIRRRRGRRSAVVQLVEAKALVIEHRAAVLAIAEALMIRRTLDDAQEIDTIIATVPARRAEWAQSFGKRGVLHAGLEG